MGEKEPLVRMRKFLGMELGYNHNLGLNKTSINSGLLSSLFSGNRQVVQRLLCST